MGDYLVLDFFFCSKSLELLLWEEQLLLEGTVCGFACILLCIIHRLREEGPVQGLIVMQAQNQIARVPGLCD